MDATTMLTKDHQVVRQLFRQFKTTGPRAAKRRHSLADRAFKALHVHTKIEEQIFYPAVRGASINNANMVAEAVAEHEAVDQQINLLRALPADDPAFADRFQDLIDSVEHHAREEERELFPAAKATLGEELKALAVEMRKRRTELEKSYDGKLTSTLRQAKTLVARAFEALSPTSQPTPKVRHTAPRRHRPRSKSTRVLQTRAAHS